MIKKSKSNNHTIYHFVLIVIEHFIKSIVSSFIWSIIAILGYIVFQSKQSPYNIMFGLPLFLVGLGFVVNSMASFYFSLFSVRYNQAVCRYCTGK